MYIHKFNKLVDVHFQNWSIDDEFQLEMAATSTDQ